MVDGGQEWSAGNSRIRTAFWSEPALPPETFYHNHSPFVDYVCFPRL